MGGDNKDSFTLERNKNSSNGIGGPRSVLFAPDVEKSSSSYSINELYKLNSNHLNAITTAQSPSASTSQLIKQTLSPLTHHRTIQQTSAVTSTATAAATSNNSIDSNCSVSPLKLKQNNHSSISMSNYPAFKSNTNFIMSNSSANINNSTISNYTSSNNGSNNGGSKTNISSLSNDNNASYKSSSPSRLSNHTNTLPSNIARSNNILYQSESGYSLKTQQPKTNHFTSPGNNGFSNIFSNSVSNTNPLSTLSTSTQSTIATHNSQSQSVTIASTASAATISANSSFSSSNIYGTLPKTSSPFNNGGGNGSSGLNATGSICGNVSAVANEFEQLIARNASNNIINSSSNNGSGSISSYGSAGNYNTLGSYRVQYSSTNPFLPSFNPQSMNDSSNTDYRLDEDK